MPRPMKDSGVEWIGEIPADWKLAPLKAVCSCFGRIGFRGYTQEDLVDEGEGAITLSPTNIIDSKLTLKKCSYISWNKYYESPEIMLFKGDIVFVKTASVGKCAIYDSDEKATVNPQFVVLKDIKCDRKFLFYTLISSVIQSPLALSNFGSVIGTITQKQLLSYKVCIPPLDEQQRIATFLDGECARIDPVIEKTRASIVEYKKLKQAIITRAVTKGIRPARTMKDSGVEWLGEIPADWEIIKIKWLLNERNERSENGKEEPLSMSQKYGLIPTKEMDIVPNMATSFIGAKLCYKNDLVFNKLKAHLGVFAVSKYYGLVSPDYSVYYASNNVNLKYLEYLFKTPQYIGEFRKKSTGVGAGLTRLYTAGLYSIYCLFPPMEEQKEIAKYLDEKTAAIDLLVEKKEQLLTELERLKKSLIFEYVTGKKAVPQ